MLFHDGKEWVKKEGNPLFDVTMGSYDGAEVCELVGLYLLGKLAPLIGTTNVGLYRDDGLAVIHLGKFNFRRSQSQKLFSSRFINAVHLVHATIIAEQNDLQRALYPLSVLAAPSTDRQTLIFSEKKT